MESVVRIQKSTLFVLMTCFSSISFSTAHAIENDPGKEYKLTEKHGPWMVMVASFRDVHEVDRKKEGMTAEQAANDLVHELREKGIPAYSYSRDAKKGTIDTYDRMGNPNKRVYAAQLDMICVLAGNYEKVDDQVAQKTLAYIKRYRPKFVSDPKSGAVVRDTGGTKGPFSAAFMTINPLRKPDDLARNKSDSVTKYLNSGIDNALVNLKRKYTLKVATFTGKSAIPMGNSRFAGQESAFDQEIKKKDGGSDSLARAGEDAAQLTYALRQSSAAARECLGSDRFEAYVYHDKYQSIVTVGGFDSPNDPEIKRLAEIFHSTYKDTKENPGKYELTCANLSLPNPKNQPDKEIWFPPLQSWAFDPIPELIEVPHIK
jgi:hypothetical protein